MKTHFVFVALHEATCYRNLARATAACERAEAALDLTGMVARVDTGNRIIVRDRKDHRVHGYLKEIEA